GWAEVLFTADSCSAQAVERDSSSRSTEMKHPRSATRRTSISVSSSVSVCPKSNVTVKRAFLFTWGVHAFNRRAEARVRDLRFGLQLAPGIRAGCASLFADRISSMARCVRRLFWSLLFGARLGTRA